MAENMETDAAATASSEIQARPYQVDLFERAKKGNSILYLPTGSGKTYVAVMLIRSLSNDLLTSFEEGGKRTIFIVNTVGLVHQQSAFIARHTGLNCKGYSGDMRVDFWNNEVWLHEIVKHEVLVMTAQIFLDLLTHGVISLQQVNLLIFDECHHATGHHPMKLIMQEFLKCSPDQKPHVLAMSASLLNSNVNAMQVEQYITDLEATFQAKIITVEDRSCVEQHATKPIEDVRNFDIHIKTDEEIKIINLANKVARTISHVDIPSVNVNAETSKYFRPDPKQKKMKRLFEDIIYHFDEMGLLGGSNCILQHLIQTERIKRITATSPELKLSLDYVTTQLMKMQKLMASKLGDIGKTQINFNAIKEYSSPKVIKLCEILHDQNIRDRDKFCCIIFVKRRFTAVVLYHILNKLSLSDQEFNFLKPDYLVGCSGDPYKNAKEHLVNNKVNKDVLTKFRAGKTNCIVATSVIDEGIDIPSCSLVIRYYAPMDYREYIQSKGRARHKMGRFISLAERGLKYKERYENFQKTEKLMEQILYGSNDNRPEPTEEQIHKCFENIIAPYTVNKNGRICSLTEDSVISLIYRYCSALQSDQFSTMLPTFQVQSVRSEPPNGLKYKVLITLPPASILRDTIVGEAMETIKLAQKSAAMKTCIKLYEIGEFNDYLLPKKPEEVLDQKNVNILFPLFETATPNSTAGTKNQFNYHDYVYPEAFTSSFPKPDQPLYLHIINVIPNCISSKNKAVLKFFEVLGSKERLAILSRKKMPLTPDFPIFMNSLFNVTISIEPNIPTSPLSDSEIDSLKQFHIVIFNEVLELVKSFMIFDYNTIQNNYLVVPVDENQKINWNVVQEHRKLDIIYPDHPIQVKTSDYENNFVKVMYRESSYYLVTTVCEFDTCKSRFPSNEFETYEKYYQGRHNITINNPDQPLILVKAIRKTLNYLRPRDAGDGVSNKKLRYEDYEEYLVPELCCRMTFPGVYWLKANLLPTILYRLSQLLVADDFRVKILQEANIGIKPWDPNSRPPPLPLKVNNDEEESDNYNSLEESLDDTISEEDEESQKYNRKIKMTRSEWAEEQRKQLEDRAIESYHFLTPELNDIASSKYVWRSQEASDIFKYADDLKVIDLEDYCKFISVSTNEDEENLKNMNANKSKYRKADSVPTPPIKMFKADNIHGPSCFDMLQALTSKGCIDSFDYDRVETLGDSLLKYISTLFLYHNFPALNEGELTMIKSKMVGNRNLYYAAIAKNLPGRMNNEEFKVNSHFIPPSFRCALGKEVIEAKKSHGVIYDLEIPDEERFSGQLSDETKKTITNQLMDYFDETNKVIKPSGHEQYFNIQVMGDKFAADCVEALVGTYLLSNGIKGSIQILKWFEVLPPSLDVDHILTCKPENPLLRDVDVRPFMPWSKQVEERIGYKFKNPAFLLQACTHPSYATHSATRTYQRLEFLGDAVIDFLITAHIYEKSQSLTPGQLTDLRMALVNNITFACLTVRYGLQIALEIAQPQLWEVVDKFVRFQDTRDHRVDDELLWCLLEEDDVRMSEYVDVPKCLGDLFESMIGAVYLDTGKDLDATWTVLYNLMHAEIAKFSKEVPMHPIRVIHEYPNIYPKWSRSVAKDESSVVTLTIMDKGKPQFFHGVGKNQKFAKTAAAKMALKYLKTHDIMKR
ncbi:hypothetical protein TKK_0004617 [Trichogramma kaykai]